MIEGKGTSLPDVYHQSETNEKFKEVEWIFTEDIFKSYSSEDGQNKEHEAGYDALLTGKTFIKAN